MPGDGKPVASHLGRRVRRRGLERVRFGDPIGDGRAVDLARRGDDGAGDAWQAPDRFQHVQSALDVVVEHVERRGERVIHPGVGGEMEHDLGAGLRDLRHRTWTGEISGEDLAQVGHERCEPALPGPQH